MRRLEREYSRFAQSLCRSTDGRGLGGTPERSAAEMGEVDPAVERLVDMHTDEGTRFYRAIQKIAQSECRKKNARFAEAVVEAVTYTYQKSLLAAAIACRKDVQMAQALNSASMNADTEKQPGQEPAKIVEKRKMVLRLIPLLHSLEETIEECKQQSSLIASGRAKNAYARRFGTKEKPREDGGDFEKSMERHGGGVANADLQQEALVAKIDRDREEEFTRRAEKAFDALLDIEKHLSSKNGVERRIYMAIRAWRRGRVVMEANNLRTGRPQDLAASYYDVSGDVMRSRSKELEAWARFFVGDQKGHASRFVAHLRNVVRNLGTRSSRHSFYHSLIAFEEAFWQDLRLSRDKARDRFQQLAFDSELNIRGNPIDAFQRERWKARMDFLDTLTADELETEQGKQ